MGDKIEQIDSLESVGAVPSTQEPACLLGELIVRHGTALKGVPPNADIILKGSTNTENDGQPTHYANLRCRQCYALCEILHIDWAVLKVDSLSPMSHHTMNGCTHEDGALIGQSIVDAL